MRPTTTGNIWRALSTGVFGENERLRLILIGERFFQNFQNWENIGDMYRYTEPFCHYSWNSPEEAKISSSLTYQYLKKKTGKYGRLKNCANQMSKIWAKSSPIRMTLTRWKCPKHGYAPQDLKMPPLLVFPELFSTVLCFSIVVVWLFVHIFSSQFWGHPAFSYQNVWKIHYLWPQFGRTTFCFYPRRGKSVGCSILKLGLEKPEQNIPERSQKAPENSLRSLTLFPTVPQRKVERGYSASNPSSSSPTLKNP